ncbi:spore coat protein [Desertibacillus haloalkaliphilus]|uniref:spore coat protein n=1 Tax=Desertibacillus haloalkaliphilus TaxID=1328930 RepID=UPI001C27E666|nr:spore coat protein [Desertibacillus haloalkaliphilus]MBU8906628.1 spore coat protein [Desertibacillus haloalkaliphilus]
MNQNSKIENPQTQVPKSPQMNDRDFINDQLSTEKYMTSSYSVAMNEASHEGLYRDIATIANETQDCQRNLFNLMFKKGWYSFEAEPQQKLNQSYQQFSGYNNQFPYS